MGNVNSKDNWQVHFRDTMRGGKFLNHWRMAELHAKEAPDRVWELETYGALFDRTPDGKISQRNFGGHEYPRLAHVGDRTGLEMIRTLQQKIVSLQQEDLREHGDAEALMKVFAETTITALLKDDATGGSGRISGAVGYTRENGTFVVFEAPAVVLATGGIGKSFKVTSNSWEYTGDGHALAMKAGATLLTGIAALVLLFVLLGSFPIVPETKQAVIVRFGKPVRILNRYKAGQPIGGPAPASRGASRSPRTSCGSTSACSTSTWSASRCCRPTSCGSRSMPSPATGSSIRCACTSRARTEDRVEQALKPILGSQLRNELGKRPFASLLSPGARRRDGEYPRRPRPRRAAIWRRDHRRAHQEGRPARRHAARIRPIDRMRTARQQEARSIRAEGAKQAQIIRAEADAAAAQTYAASFGKDPEFYDFYRAMQSLSDDLLGDGHGQAGADDHHPVAENDYLKEFYWTLGDLRPLVQFAFMRLT